MTDELQELVAQLDAGRDAFLQAVASADPSAADRRPGADAWSVLECAEHVALAEEHMRSRLAAATRAGEPLLNAARERRIRQRAPDRTHRVEAPEAARPAGRFPSTADAVASFLRSREKTVEFVRSWEGDLRCLVADHPVIGSVNGYELLLMMAAHPLRHSHQIREAALSR